MKLKFYKSRKDKLTPKKMGVFLLYKKIFKFIELIFTIICKFYKGGVCTVFGIVKTVFELIQKVLGIYSMVITVIEMDYRELEGSEKEKKALEWLGKILDEQVERGNLPGWARRIFFTERFKKWIISVLVKAAHEIGIFEHKGEETEQSGN